MEQIMVHPRRCGELLVINFQLFLNNGSSPQVRGTRVFVSVESVRFRFIPAGAGNSIHRSLTVAVFTVHPRRCGELNNNLSFILFYAGSSPQVRGTLLPLIPMVKI